MVFSENTLRSCLASDALHLMILPTEACNFRCSYCYETFEHGRMAPELVVAIKAFLSRRAPGLKWLYVSWFGGEPLCAPDIVLDLQEHAARLAGQHPEMRLGGGISTNGWFLERPLFERLLALELTGYQISVDGPPEVHDRQRVRANGKGTFARIWQNLLDMRDVTGEFSISIRIHVDRDNLRDLPGFIERCGEAFGGDPRFRLYLRPLSRLGSPRDGALPILDGARDAAAIAALRALAISRDLSCSEGEEELPVCYASKANSFVVRADGRLNKCTVALEHPANQVGRLREDGTLALQKDQMMPWMRGLFSDDPDAARCPLMDLGGALYSDSRLLGA